MSSILRARSALKDFLTCPEAQVLYLTGEWGVGKTYLWNEAVARVAETGEIARKKYSYVSLFGLNSLAEVKASIAENMQILPLPDMMPVAATVVNSALSSIKYLKGFTSVIPYVGSGISQATPTFLYSTTASNLIVCIDDLDRRGASLRVEDILGLVTSLRDERGCSVALLLNEGKVEDEEKRRLIRHYEKVVDARLVLAPSPVEAAEVAIKASDEISHQVSENCTRLGISNIRVIRKIHKLVNSVMPLIENRSDTIKRQAVDSLTILGWSRFQPDYAPSFPFYLESPYQRILDSKNGEEISDEEAYWTGIVEQYKFQNLDDFDKALLTFAESLEPNDEAIIAAAEKEDTEVDRRAAAAAVEAGFNPFHASFDDNADEVSASIVDALKQNYKFVSLGVLGESVGILKSIGKATDAAELLKFFEDNQDAEFWEPENDFFGRSQLEPDIQKAMVRHKQAAPASIDLERELLRAAKNYNQDAVKRIASELTPDKMTALILAHKGERMRSIIYAGLEYRRIANASEEMRQVVDITKLALIEIGKKSPLNSARVEKYGLATTNDQATSDKGSDSCA